MPKIKINSVPTIRPATQLDSRTLAELINLAGEGLPKLLWQEAAEQSPGDTAMTVGCRRAAREEGGFSYRNALIVEFADQPAAMILSYALPDPYELNDIDEYPVIVQPLVTLESQAAGTWYINAVATYDQFRGQGLASRLMDTVESMAMQNQFTSMSLIVADSNQQAKRLYTNRGYQQTAVAAVVPAPGLVIQGDWVLMIKSLD